MAAKKNKRPRSRATSVGPSAGSSSNTNGAEGEGPRRLGDQQRSRPTSRSAANRYQRAKARRNRRLGWLSVTAVVALLAALVVYKLTNDSSQDPSTSQSSGRHPAVMPANIVRLITTIPNSTYDTVGVASSPAPFTVTKSQPALTSGSRPLFVFYGAEYCPWCALTRWAVVAALSRFGTFSGLKQISSASDDQDIPTFSFLGSTYTSKYLVFHPYEVADRNENALQSPPLSVDKLYLTYDGNPDTETDTAFSQAGGEGIPFLDIGNKYVSAGAPGPFDPLVYTFANGGPGRLVMAEAIHSPTSTSGKNLGTDVILAEANYISAAICAVDGGKPASVCQSSGVLAARKMLDAQKTIS